LPGANKHAKATMPTLIVLSKVLPLQFLHARRWQPFINHAFMNQFGIFIMIFLLIGCSSKTIDSSNRFKNYCSSLSNVSLPLKISCGFDSGTIGTNDLNQFRDFIPSKMDRLYGYLSCKDSITLILYGQTGDDIYPYLYSYDFNGKIQDSLFLIINPCGGADDKVIPHSFALIDEDLKIDLIDTSRYITYKDNMNYSVDSILISEKLYKIDNKGYFKMARENIKK
jgi:hypothetical protein